MASDDTTTEDELLQATGEALETHGVGDLTTQRIADEWGKAQSLVHYYYDTKEDLVVAYIDRVRERFVDSYESHADEPPLERIRALFGDAFGGPSDGPDLGTVLLELHAHAPHNDAYRRALDDLESTAREFVEDTIRDGVETGEFRDVDPAATAVMLLSAHDGAMVRTRMLARTDDVDLVRDGLETYLRECLLAGNANGDDGATGDADGGGVADGESGDADGEDGGGTRAREGDG